MLLLFHFNNNDKNTFKIHGRRADPHARVRIDLFMQHSRVRGVCVSHSEGSTQGNQILNIRSHSKNKNKNKKKENSGKFHKENMVYIVQGSEICKCKCDV